MSTAFYAELAARLEQRLGDAIVRVASADGVPSYRVASGELRTACRILRDELGFEMLMDLCGVDYLHYGATQWQTRDATDQGFSRAADRLADLKPLSEAPPAQSVFVATAERPARFAVAYQLLSIQHNARLRLKAFCADDERPQIDSVIEIWRSADWFEREAFDLFGILFQDHPDLRRLLTDYGFIGHPFRKDFPLIGNVEVRYDPERGRVVYEPVSIQPRTLVPRVIREDNRYDPQIQRNTSFREAGPDA